MELTIAEYIGVLKTAENLIDELEKSILTLDLMPQCGVERKVGVYANEGYRQVLLRILQLFIV